MWELHKLIHNRTKERSEEVRAIKRMNGSSLIFPWKREKKKVNKFTTEKPLPEVSIPGAWPGQFKGGGRVTLCQIEGTHQIVMSTSMPYLKKVCKGGGEDGVGGGGGGKLRAAQDPSLRRNVFATQLRLVTCGFTR